MEIKRKLSESEKYYTQQLKNLEKQGKPSYEGSTWDSKVNDLAARILNREKFDYDVNGDAIYNQYKKQYVDLGKKAMDDTTAKASELTGGYGNSYGVTAGNQAYQGYLDQLNGRIPELYSLAMQKYNADSQNLMNNYGVAKEMASDDFNKFQLNLEDYYANRDYIAGRADNATNVGMNEYSMALNEYLNDKNFNYQKERDQVSDAQWKKSYDASLRSSGGSKSSNGMSVSAYNTMMQQLNEYADDKNWDAIANYIMANPYLTQEQAESMAAMYLPDSYFEDGSNQNMTAPELLELLKQQTKK